MHFKIILVQCFLTLYTVKPYVLLAANIDDIKNIARKFISDKIVDKIVDSLGIHEEYNKNNDSEEDNVKINTENYNFGHIKEAKRFNIEKPKGRVEDSYEEYNHNKDVILNNKNKEKRTEHHLFYDKTEFSHSESNNEDSMNNKNDDSKGSRDEIENASSESMTRERNTKSNVADYEKYNFDESIPENDRMVEKGEIYQ